MRHSGCICAVLWLVASAAVTEGKPKAIHVFVALCDNEHQGIVPVPKQLGNGDDPANNLYWGALYGTKAFLNRSKDWTLVATQKRPSEAVLERAIFKHGTTGARLVADAYRGARIKDAIADFFNAAAGNDRASLRTDGTTVGIHGAAELVVYVGHNGLMDFSIPPPKPGRNTGPKNAIVLACKSRPYFQPRLGKLGCRSLLLTTGFMAPEAYTLEAALAGWLARETGADIRERAARAYHKYQKCGLRAARRLFYTEQ